MLHRSDGIKLHTGINGLGNGVKRVMGGESMFRNKYTNATKGPASIARTPGFPSKIFPIDLSRSGSLSLQPGLYFAHIGDVHITFKFTRNIAAGCFGWSGLLLLKVTGTGIVFLNGGGR
jgi:uncharacterized protein (AIM24 family)